MIVDLSWYCLQVSNAEIAVTCSIVNFEKPVVLPIATWKILASPWNNNARIVYFVYIDMVTTISFQYQRTDIIMSE